MTGPESAVFLMAIAATFGVLIALYDWWTRRKDRGASPRRGP